MTETLALGALALVLALTNAYTIRAPILRR